MYNFDELTSISLLISLYIAVAFYIYFQQKREWKNIVEHIRDSGSIINVVVLMKIKATTFIFLRTKKHDKFLIKY